MWNFCSFLKLEYLLHISHFCEDDGPSTKCDFCFTLLDIRKECDVFDGGEDLVILEFHFMTTPL